MWGYRSRMGPTCITRKPGDPPQITSRRPPAALPGKIVVEYFNLMIIEQTFGTPPIDTEPWNVPPVTNTDALPSGLTHSYVIV